jgi:hypothetical protein
MRPPNSAVRSVSKGEQQMSQWEQETPDTATPDEVLTPEKDGGQEGGGNDGGQEGGGESGGEPTDAPA